MARSLPSSIDLLVELAQPFEHLLLQRNPAPPGCRQNQNGCLVPKIRTEATADGAPGRWMGSPGSVRVL